MEKLPSLFQRGDYVSVTFPGTGLLKRCKVLKVSFAIPKKEEIEEPFYDVEVPYNYYDGTDADPVMGYARIHGLKEWHLRNPEMPVADREPLPKN